MPQVIEHPEVDYSFEVHGEVFTARKLDASVIAELDDQEFPTKLVDQLERVEQRIEAMLEPEDVGRWKALRADKETRPLSFSELDQIMAFCVEVQSGDRPTGQPSPSEPGGGNGGASSTAGSRSRGARRKR